MFLTLGSCHLFAIFLWAFFLYLTQTLHTLIDAILFAGSCYTTLGYMGDQLPTGWRLIALFIAISGLFSFSLSTATILAKTSNFRMAWKGANKEKLIKYLKKHNLDESDFESL